MSFDFKRRGEALTHIYMSLHHHHRMQYFSISFLVKEMPFSIDFSQVTVYQDNVMYKKSSQIFYTSMKQDNSIFSRNVYSLMFWF